MKTVMFLLLIFVSANLARAETLVEKQKRLDDLKQQVTQLEQEIARETLAAEKPKQDSLEETLNTLPKNLYPADSENDIKKDLRRQWVSKNLTSEMGPWKFTGKLIHIDQVTRQIDKPQPGSPDTKSVIHVTLSCPVSGPVWGITFKELKLDAYLDGDHSTEAANWAADGSLPLTVTGKVTMDAFPDTSTDSLLVKMEPATLEK